MENPRHPPQQIISRRDFLLFSGGLALTAAALLVFGRLYWKTREPTNLLARAGSLVLEGETLGEKLRALAFELPGLADLGGHYLAAHPREDRVETLIDLLLADIEPGAAATVADEYAASTAFLAATRARIQRDFVEDRTVEVDGWVLARTEARIAALVALLGQN